MPRPSNSRLRDAFDALERHIEDHYGIPVRIADVRDPFTGDLDGAEIEIDHDQSIEDALFVLVHLFGHTVQWNVCAEARAIGEAQLMQPDADQLVRIRAYEEEACAYSLQLLHDAGFRDMDQWLSDFAACDYAYLEHFYRTGEKGAFRSFWRDGMPLVRPLAIPAFQPARWRSRWDGTVL